MKHILFIQPSLDSVGGIEKVIPVLAKNLVKRNYLVSAYVFYNKIPQTQNLWYFQGGEDEEVALGLLNKFKKVIRRLFALRNFIKQTKPDVLVVSAQGAIVLSIILRTLRIIRVPVVAYVHEARGDGGLFYRLLTAIFYPFADSLIAVSRGIEKELRLLWFVNKSKINLIYNALPEINFDEQKNKIINERLKNYEHPLYVTAGRLEKKKGADVLVKSFLDYFKNNPGTLIVLGTGSLLTCLEKMVTQDQMEGRIVFLGRVEEVPIYVSNCNIYISMARSEPFGLALIEALSVGVPVIATDVPSGPHEILSPGITPDKYPYKAAYGILLTKPDLGNDSKSLEEGIKILEDNTYGSYDPEKLKRRAADFSPQIQAELFSQVIENISVSEKMSV